VEIGGQEISTSRIAGGAWRKWIDAWNPLWRRGMYSKRPTGVKRRPMVRTCALCFLLSGVVSVGAGAAPQIAVDLATYSFPDTVEGIAVAHTFVLSNVGDQELVIESAGPSCSCTKITTELATNRLQPGQSVELYALLDTNGISGRDPKQIKVTSNDPTRQPPNELTLTMVGNVIERQPYEMSVGDLVYDSYILLDVRDAAAYAAGHLMGAMNVPASQAATLASSLPPTVLTVFYDQDGNSATASGVTQTFHGAGLAYVYALTGGFDQWQESYGSTRVVSGEDPSWGAFLDVSGARSYSDSAVVKKYYVAQLRTDYILIDIRSASAFAGGHLAGAVNLSEADLGAYIEALPRETPVIVYSGDGADSERAAYSLWTEGSRAKSLLGGLTEWQKLHGSLLLVSSDK
jgi:rhodanese-related sulfurtransferase